MNPSFDYENIKNILLLYVISYTHRAYLDCNYSIQLQLEITLSTGCKKAYFCIKLHLNFILLYMVDNFYKSKLDVAKMGLLLQKGI